MSVKKYKYCIGYKNEEKVKLSYIILPKMSERARHFDKTRCMSFSQKMMNYQKNIKNSGKKAAIVLNRSLIVNQYTMSKIL